MDQPDRGNPATNAIRVLVADAHEAVRSALNAFVTAYDMELVGEAADGKQALRQCRALQPDVVLMDLMMPKSSGVVSAEIIHKRWPQIKVIALTSVEDDDLVNCARDIGIVTYLLKQISAEELASTIRAVYTGQPTKFIPFSDNSSGRRQISSV